MTQVSLRSILFLALSVASLCVIAAGCEEEECFGHDGLDCVLDKEEGGGGAAPAGTGGAGGEGGASAQEGGEN